MVPRMVCSPLLVVKPKVKAPLLPRVLLYLLVTVLLSPTLTRLLAFKPLLLANALPLMVVS